MLGYETNCVGRKDTETLSGDSHHEFSPYTTHRRCNQRKCIASIDRKEYDTRVFTERIRESMKKDAMRRSRSGGASV